jgi:hypothetical protein
LTNPQKLTKDKNATYEETHDKQMKTFFFQSVLPIVGAFAIGHGTFQIHPGLSLIALGVAAIAISLTWDQ